MDKVDKLVININGSAGVGKTTFAKKLQEFIIEYSNEDQKYNKFALKLKPELVGEFATELIEQGRFEDLKNQPFVTQGQVDKLEQAFKKSDLVITDSPLVLGRIYNQDDTKINEVSNLINEAEQKYISIDLFLEHNEETIKTYNMQGRVHTLAQSMTKQNELLDNLYASGKKFITINRNGDLEMIYAKIQNTKEFRAFEDTHFGKSTFREIVDTTNENKNKEKSIRKKR